MSDAHGSEQDSVTQRLRENVVGIVSALVTAIWMGAMFTGQDWWLAALLIGYIAVVPITAKLFGDEEDQEEWLPRDADDSESQDEETPLETLRRRYAEGELSEEQFERKLDQLLSTETIEDVEDERERAVERER
jgi:uncharacterized membrane protein